MISQLLDIALRSGVIYIIILLGLRLLGKNHLSQLSILDFVLVLLLSNAVQNAMVGNDSTLLGGVIAAVTLLLLNYLLTAFMYRFKSADALFQGSPTMLVHDGNLLQEHMRREKISDEELRRAIREHGMENISDVKVAILESDGTLSVIPKGDGERRIEAFRHRKTKFQQRKN